jgi:hypothetical protein
MRTEFQENDGINHSNNAYRFPARYRYSKSLQTIKPDTKQESIHLDVTPMQSLFSVFFTLPDFISSSAIAVFQKQTVYLADEPHKGIIKRHQPFPAVRHTSLHIPK